MQVGFALSRLLSASNVVPVESQEVTRANAVFCCQAAEEQARALVAQLEAANNALQVNLHPLKHSTACLVDACAH